MFREGRSAPAAGHFRHSAAGHRVAGEQPPDDVITPTDCWRPQGATTAVACNEDKQRCTKTDLLRADSSASEHVQVVTRARQQVLLGSEQH